MPRIDTDFGKEEEKEITTRIQDFEREQYRIRICFNGGECGIVDLKGALWGPVFEPLKDLDVFKRFRVSDVLHTVCWENNADLAPEFLYDKMVEQAVAHGRAGAHS